MNEQSVDHNTRYQSLSALADGEATASEVTEACANWRDDDGARQVWASYQLIGDVLRSEELASTAQHDHFLSKLRQRLAEAHQEVGRHLHRLGFELFTESDEGMYVWARHRAIPDSAALLDDALEQGIMLGPGQLFMVDAQATGWMRFNVAFSTDPAMWELLEKILVKQVRRSAI